MDNGSLPLGFPGGVPLLGGTPAAPPLPTSFKLELVLRYGLATHLSCDEIAPQYHLRLGGDKHVPALTFMVEGEPARAYALDPETLDALKRFVLDLIDREHEGDEPSVPADEPLPAEPHE